MKEEELNATMSVIADPINNVYKLDSRQAVEEIQRICRIFANYYCIWTFLSNSVSPHIFNNKRDSLLVLED
jgi:hypothetical protein